MLSTSVLDKSLVVTSIDANGLTDTAYFKDASYQLTAVTGVTFYPQSRNVMSDFYNFSFTAEELKLIVQNLSEASQRWRTIASESPFPDAVEASRTEWLGLTRILEKLDPACWS